MYGFRVSARGFIGTHSRAKVESSNDTGNEMRGNN